MITDGTNPFHHGRTGAKQLVKATLSDSAVHLGVLCGLPSALPLISADLKPEVDDTKTG